MHPDNHAQRKSKLCNCFSSWPVWHTLSLIESSEADHLQCLHSAVQNNKNLWHLNNPDTAKGSESHPLQAEKTRGSGGITPHIPNSGICEI